jgi:hypothetical protein
MQRVAIIKTLVEAVTKGHAQMCAFVMLAGLVSGCAFANVNVSLPADTTAGYSGGQGRALIIPTFVDRREVKERVGMQKNNFGMDTASAVPDQSVDAWLTARLASELRSAGFQIVSEGPNPKASRVQGYILKLFIEPVQQWMTVDLETDLSVRIRVTRPDGVEAERQYFVKGVEQGLASLAGSYTASVRKATDTLMKRIVADVINLLNRFPEA